MVELTAISASMAGRRSSRARTRVIWFSSSFDRAFDSEGAEALRFSRRATYSSRDDDTAWNVAVIFHGFVDRYTRGESMKGLRHGSAAYATTKP